MSPSPTASETLTAPPRDPRRLPEGIRISEGTFTRHYSFPGQPLSSVAYHTPTQSVVFLEGDSAEVWRHLHASKGDTAAALDYILQHGNFEQAPHAAAQAILAEFVESLESADLIGWAPPPVSRDSAIPGAAPAVRQAVDPTQNPELAISQFMADHHVFYSLTLELTYRCNERCVHCYLPTETRLAELSPRQIDALLGEFVDLGGLMLHLTGGELLFRKDIVEILNLARSHGLVTSITSNLTLLNDPVLDALIQLRPRSVGCSIYAASAELHDAITTIRGSFDRSIAAIRRLRAAGLPVIIKSPLLQSTAPGWREIEQLAGDLGCEYQFDLSITAKNDGGLSPLGQRVEDMDLLHEIFASRYYKLYNRDEAMFTLTRPSPDAVLCGAGAAGLCVSPDGTIRPCIGLNVGLGKWPGNPLSEIWQSSPFFSEFGAIRLRDIPECSDCPDFLYCSRCPGAWHAERGDFRKPTPYTCKLARAWASAQADIKQNSKGGEMNEVGDQS